MGFNCIFKQELILSKNQEKEEFKILIANYSQIINHHAQYFANYYGQHNSPLRIRGF